jgi:putative ABC transport system permease protein
MWRITLASLRAHVRRLVSTSIAVCLGVAFLAGSMVLGDTLRSNFDKLFQSSLGRADAVVRSATNLDTDGEFAQGLVDAGVADQLRSIPGVDGVAPEIQGFGQLTGADGEKLGGKGPPTYAGNWIDDPQLNPYELVEGRAPAAPDEVVINRGAAKDGHLHVGDTTTIATPEPLRVKIVGIATFGGEDGFGPTTFAAFSLAGAEQHVLGRSGQVTALLVRAHGMSQSELVDRIAPVVPAGAEVISGHDLVQEANDSINADFLGFVRTFLLVFAGVALLVATFSIHNTFSIIVAQRVRESSLLRAVGAHRRQVLASSVGETIVVGVLASMIGLFLGLGLAQLLKLMFDAFGFALPAGGLTIRPTTWVIAPLVGILVTVLAGLAPSLRSSRVPPLAALRDVAVDRSAVSPWRIGLGLVAVGAGVVAVLSAVSSGDALGLAALGAMLTSAGAVILGPVVARPGASVIGAPLARVRGLAGGLARRNAVRSPRRTAATASALMIGLGVVTMFTAFAGSLKTSLRDNVDNVITGDLLIASSSFGGGGLSPSLAPALDGVEGVDHTVGVAVGPVSIEHHTLQVSVMDAPASAGLLEPSMTAGSIPSLAANQVGLAKSVADEHHWRMGSTLDVTFPDGRSAPMTVGAIYKDVPMLRDGVVARSTWMQHSVQTIDSLVVIGLVDSTDVGAAQQRIEQAAAAYSPPDVQTRQQFVDDSTAMIDSMLGLVYVMLVLAIVIALMGIANTLSLSIYERVRELGLLRAVGATQAQVRSMVRWESVVIALFGTVGGLALGLFLGWALVTAASSALANVHFSVPVAQLVPIVVVGALSGALAAWRPARRAARVDVVEALAAN